MSAQVNDKFQYSGNSYDITLVQHPDSFFCIHKLGISPASIGTGCYRGYIASFALSGDKLILRNLQTGINKESTMPVKINGIMPEVERPGASAAGFGYRNVLDYRDVNIVIPYSGSIIVTDDFISELYIHSGFQSLVSYRKVLEIVFDNGCFVKEYDLSDIVKLIRETNTEFDIEEMNKLPWWVVKCFGLDLKKLVENLTSNYVDRSKCNETVTETHLKLSPRAFYEKAGFISLDPI